MAHKSHSESISLLTPGIAEYLRQRIRFALLVCNGTSLPAFQTSVPRRVYLLLGHRPCQACNTKKHEMNLRHCQLQQIPNSNKGRSRVRPSNKARVQAPRQENNPTWPSPRTYDYYARFTGDYTVGAKMTLPRVKSCKGSLVTRSRY